MSAWRTATGWSWITWHPAFDPNITNGCSQIVRSAVKPVKYAPRNVSPTL